MSMRDSPTEFIPSDPVTLVKAEVLYGVCVCSETDASQTNQNCRILEFFKLEQDKVLFPFHEQGQDNVNTWSINRLIC